MRNLEETDKKARQHSGNVNQVRQLVCETINSHQRVDYQKLSKIIIKRTRIYILRVKYFRNLKYFTKYNLIYNFKLLYINLKIV